MPSRSRVAVWGSRLFVIGKGAVCYHYIVNYIVGRCRDILYRFLYRGTSLRRKGRTLYREVYREEWLWRRP